MDLSLILKTIKDRIESARDYLTSVILSGKDVNIEDEIYNTCYQLFPYTTYHKVIVDTIRLHIKKEIQLHMILIQSRPIIEDIKRSSLKDVLKKYSLAREYIENIFYIHLALKGHSLDFNF